MARKTFVILFAVFFLAACGSQSASPAPSAQPALSENNISATPMPSPTATAVPEPRVLTVCLGEEPASLFPPQAVDRGARTVLAAVYDGPLEHDGFALLPVLLARLPSLENGDVAIEAVPVQVGQEVVGTNGQPVTLDDGVLVRPAGCRSDDCAVSFDRDQPLKMDQMQVVFRLRPGLRWADGQPLTAADSVYAWALWSNPALSSYLYLPDRTADYRALDAETLVWVGKPGFIDPQYQDNFIHPLPAHLWAAFSPLELAESEMAARLPLGWGPYVIQSWEPGQQIRLTRNPIYAGEQPHYDELIFRFTPNAEAALADLLAGRCDVLDESVPLGEQLGLLQELDADGRVHLLARTALTMEVLALGIRPAAYDDGYQPGLFGDRPDYFGDPRTRQALAYCLNRQQLTESLWGDLTYVPDSLVPPQSPLYDPTIPIYTYDPEKGRALLAEVGWKDLDNNPATPLTAWSVVGVPQGTPLTLQYWTTDAAFRRQAADLLAESLAACGISIETNFLPPETFFADGPAGVLFGRQFDLAEFAVGTLEGLPPCYWYTQDAIPSAANGWLGINVSGYASETYDVLCRQAYALLPDDARYLETWGRLQQVFARELPVIPLYARPYLSVTQPDLCGDFPDDGYALLTERIESWRPCAP